MFDEDAAFINVAVVKGSVIRPSITFNEVGREAQNDKLSGRLTN